MANCFLILIEDRLCQSVAYGNNWFLLFPMLTDQIDFTWSGQLAYIQQDYTVGAAGI